MKIPLRGLSTIASYAPPPQPVSKNINLVGLAFLYASDFIRRTITPLGLVRTKCTAARACLFWFWLAPKTVHLHIQGTGFVCKVISHQ